MDRLTVALLTVGVALLLVAALAGMQLVARIVAARARSRDVAGLVTLGVFFVVALVAVFGLTASGFGRAIPGP